MTVPQARLLQDRYYSQQPLMRFMDLVYRIAAKGKPLWDGADKPKAVSAERPEAVENMAETLKRLGWTPPPKK